MAQTNMNVSHQDTRWNPSINRAQYDCNPELTEIEKRALTQLNEDLAQREQMYIPQQQRNKLTRLLRPLFDLQQSLKIKKSECLAAICVILHDIHDRSKSYWTWSEAEWIETVTSSSQRFRPKYLPQTQRRIRTRLMVIAYTFGPQTDFFLPFLGEEMFPQVLALHIFGKELLEDAVERVCGTLSAWGYSIKRNREMVSTFLAEVFLVNRSPYLEDITIDLLIQLREGTKPYMQSGIERFSSALAHLGIIEHALPSWSETRKVSPEQINTDGIAPEWVEWCLQWYHFSSLSPDSRRRYLYQLIRVGRWLAVVYPEVTTPHQWTSKIAAEYVVTLSEMKEGDFCLPGIPKKWKGDSSERYFLASTQSTHLNTLRTFFKDLQDEPHNMPRRFDPSRIFRLRPDLKNQLGPNPRDLDPLIWAKIVHAALNLAAEDLLRAGKGKLHYPLELVRAVAAVWVYSGLRSDEITRLQVGCIRWQREDVTIPETGEILPSTAVCFLTVPVNKTFTTFQKPVNPIMGKRINEWEQLRASSMPNHNDRKTRKSVDNLFSHRAKAMSKEYLNQSLIPTICAKAGIPPADERGAITSHRARATIATLLYNAPEGLSIFELMHWLGHTSPKSTQHYARVKPTKLAAAYAKAERTSSLVEALVDTKADKNGDVKVYYVLGDHGLCGNPDWATCLYRMACIKCPFFVPKDLALLIEARKTVKRFMEVVELTDEEQIAAQDDYDKLEEAIQRTKDQPIPTTLRRRAKGTKNRGIPLTMLHNE